MESSFTLVLENPRKKDKAKHLECLCRTKGNRINVEIMDINTQKPPSPKELPNPSTLRDATYLWQWAMNNLEVFAEGKVTKDLGRKLTKIKRKPKP